VRAEAAATLGALGADGAGPRLAALLFDPDEEVRVRAIYALKSIGHRDANDHLRGLAIGPPGRVSTAAAAALEILDEPRGE
jgi:HEAT repeat protein